MAYIKAQAYPSVVNEGFQSSRGRVFIHDGNPNNLIPIQELSITLECNTTVQDTKNNVAEFLEKFVKITLGDRRVGAKFDFYQKQHCSKALR